MDLLEQEYVASGGEKITLTYLGEDGADVGWEAQITGGGKVRKGKHKSSLERAIFSALRVADDDAEITDETPTP